MKRAIAALIGLAVVAGACALAQVVPVDGGRVARGGDFARRFTPSPPDSSQPTKAYGSIQSLQPVRLPS